MDEFLDNKTNNDYLNGTSSDCTQMYLSEINVPVLTFEEERELLNKIAMGDEKAKEKLIYHNLRLVVYVAKMFPNTGVAYLDLIQEGNIGLMKAIEKFDCNKGHKFSTYATWWIKNYIERYIKKYGRIIYLPNRTSDNIRKYKAVAGELHKNLGRTPTVEEIAEEMGITAKKARQYQNKSFDTLSLNALVGEEKDTELGEFISDGDLEPAGIYDNKMLKEELRDLLLKCKLNERELKIILLRYGFITGTPVPLEKIGKILEISKQRVSQIEQKALSKIRKIKETEEFIEYCDNPQGALETLNTYRILQRKKEYKY